MNLKSKILAAGLSAIIAGGGIFAANMNTAQAQPAESTDVAQLEAQVLQLQQQIAQISALIVQLKSQETCGNGICRFGETTASCPADCNTTSIKVSANSLLSNYVYAGDKKVLIYSLNILANGSDMDVQRVTLQFSGAPYKYLSNIYLYNGNTLLTSSPLNNTTVSTVSNFDHEITLSNFSNKFVIPKGTAGRLDIKVDVISPLAGVGAIAKMYVITAPHGIRAVDQSNVNYYGSESSETMGFMMIISNKPACGNNVCEAETGESTINCPADCSGTAPGLLPNASKCTLNSECASGSCSYGTCCTAAQCGWGDDGAGGPRMCVDSKDEKTNQWLQGICINGTWETVLNGIGCNNFACLSGTCINNKCTCTTADCGKRTCYGEGEGEIGMTAGTAMPCCSGLTAQPRTTSYADGTQATTEGFVCRKPITVSCKKEGELFGYLEGKCCDGLLKVYPDGAKTYSAGESQNFQVTCKKPANYITSTPDKCIAVNIKAVINNKYVTAENGGSSPLIANRDTAGPWELFYISPAADGSINIKAGFNGKYVTAENGGASPLIANRDTAGPWEKFVLAPIFNTNEVAIMASINNRYVTAENGGAQALVANRDEIGPWEKFTITKVSDCQIQ